MLLITISLIVFFIMLTIPLWISYIYYKRNKTNPIFINQDKVRNPRYFAKSFSSMFEKALLDYDGQGEMTFSKREKIYETVNGYEVPDVCDRIVYSTGDEFNPKVNTHFNKEIYAKHNAILNKIPLIRAVYCKGDMIIGQNTNVIRWADAIGTISVFDNSNLGVSATSKTGIMLGKNIKFKRLYSPVNYFGMYPSEQIQKYVEPSNTQICNHIIRNCKYIDETYSTKEDDTIVKSSFISKHSVVIGENMEVLGDIRSHKIVKLCNNSVVTGNIFAEKGVVLENGCKVLGTIFSHETIVIGDNCQIGRANKIVSVITSEKIIIGSKTTVYGYVGGEKGCLCCPKASQANKVGDMVYLKLEEQSKDISLNKKQYKNIDEEGYRHNHKVCCVALPYGATKVNKGLFFDCKGLNCVSLSDTITTIEEYGFYGCEKLTNDKGNSFKTIKQIHQYAFEGCTSLEEIELLNIETIGTGAFRNCENLKKIDFGQSLKVLSNHCFSGCSKLEEITIPSSIEEVGQYAFYRCTSLKRVYVPRDFKFQSHLPSMIEIIYQD